MRKDVANTFANAKKRPRISNVIWRNGWACLVIQVDGVRRWRSLRTRYVDEARERASELAWRIRNGDDPLERRRRGPGPSLEELLQRFLSARQGDYRPETTRTVSRRYEVFRAWAATRRITRPEQVRPEDILEFRAHRQKTVKPVSAASELRAVKTVFSLAFRFEWIRDNPFARLPRAPKIAQAERAVLPWRTIEKVLRIAARTPYRHALEAATFAGLRAAEIVNLRWGDVDLERGLIHIVNRPPEFTVKTGVARSLPLAAELRSRWAGRHAKGERVSPTAKVGTFSQDVGALLRKAGVKGGNHALRHNWITYLLLAGVPLASVMAHAGHLNLSTTQGYTHVRQAVAKEDVAAFKAATQF